MRHLAGGRGKLLCRQGDLIDDGGIVTELEVELAALRMGNREHVAGEAVGDFDRVGELRIAGH
jgi:hypothetical protein